MGRTTMGAQCAVDQQHETQNISNIHVPPTQVHSNVPPVPSTSPRQLTLPSTHATVIIGVHHLFISQMQRKKKGVGMHPARTESVLHACMHGGRDAGWPACFAQRARYSAWPGAVEEGRQGCHSSTRTWPAWEERRGGAAGSGQMRHEHIRMHACVRGCDGIHRPRARLHTGCRFAAEAVEGREASVAGREG